MENLILLNLQTAGSKLINELITNQAKKCKIIADNEFSLCGKIANDNNCLLVRTTLLIFVQQINQLSLE